MMNCERRECLNDLQSITQDARNLGFFLSAKSFYKAWAALSDEWGHCDTITAAINEGIENFRGCTMNAVVDIIQRAEDTRALIAGEEY